MSGLPLGSFFQLGYVCRNVQQATDRLRSLYGIERFRFREHSMMAQAHFYLGGILFELIEPRDGAPQIYVDFLPEGLQEIRLQHQGYRVDCEATWNTVNHEIDRLGLATDLRGSILNDELRFVYADTVKDLGHYTEYVYLRGEQKSLYYSDVPANPGLFERSLGTIVSGTRETIV